MATFTQATTNINGKPVTYFVAGEGLPILALHSAYGVRLAPALEMLAETFRVYVPVAPGFDGTAAHDGVATMTDLADLAASFINTEIKQPCDVLGHSFGGRIAAWLAVRHPDLVEQLILHAAAGFRLEDKGGLVTDPDQLRALMFAHPENLPPEQKPAAMLGANRAAASSYGQSTARDEALIAELASIKALTLILHGTRDGIIPTESAQLLKERVPKATLMYVYDAAHSIDTDQPERFCNLVKDFFTLGAAFIVNWGREPQPA